MAALSDNRKDNTAGESECKPTLKLRQIRALYDADTITVYQAYNSEIASAAVGQQKLSASPNFRLTRMTWIKPSWCWMMYRAGYSYKDKNQERILALNMRHEHFIELLENATMTTEPGGPAPISEDAGGHEKSGKQRSSSVRVQWDPERSPRLEKLGYRSIQIGIPSLLAETWARYWIAGIEDVTERARALEKEIRENPDITDKELVRRGLVPFEKEYIVPQRVQEAIGMVQI